MAVKKTKNKFGVFSRNIKPSGKKPDKNGKKGGRLNRLEKDMSEVKKGMNYLTVVVEEMRGDFKEFKAELHEVKIKGDATFEEVGGIKVEITEIKMEITEIKDRLDRIESRMDRIESRMDNVELRLNNIETELKSIKNEINELKASSNNKAALEQLESLEKRVVKIEERVKA